MEREKEAKKIDFLKRTERQKKERQKKKGGGAKSS